jgi:carbonic anhydrase/acetyltransferase-like protein (isoleucine patch superfamily)
MNRDRILTISTALNLVFLGMILGGWSGPNTSTSFNETIDNPRWSKTTFVHPMSTVTGNVYLGERVYVAPSASVRGDEGQSIYIGDESNVQDGVVLHGLETEDDGIPVEKNLVTGLDGKKYSVYVGKKVSMAHQSQVHGPAKVGDGSFIGMQALVFKAELGMGVVVEPGAKVIGVRIMDGRYVPAGSVINKQELADKLPTITEDYPFRTLNEAVVHVNTQLADGYRGVRQEHSSSH